MSSEDELKQKITELAKLNKLQSSAINILLMAYWKLYYDLKAFPGADAVRRIESQHKEWSQ